MSASPTGKGKGLRRAVILLALAVVLPARSTVPAQSREWWDLYDDARKIVENEKASEDALKSARRSLQQVMRAQPSEGNLPTYNPSVRIDYMPWFYLGWAEMRLGRYDEAARAFKKSEEIGFIKKDAPRDARERFAELSRLVVALEPASAALESARKSSSVKECLGGSGIRSSGPLRDAIGRLEALLATPRDSASLDSAVKALDDSVKACVGEVAGARMAALLTSYREARDAVNVQGLAALLGAGGVKEVADAVAAGDQAESRGDEKALRAATQTLEGLKSKVPAAVDDRLSALARESASVTRGNESVLDEENRLASRLGAATAKARSQRASGKSGAALASVVASGLELDQLVGEARRALRPALQEGQRSLGTARANFESWVQTRSCELEAVGAMDSARRAIADADAALRGSSADALVAAGAGLDAVRRDVDSKVAGAIPRARQQASGIAGSAESVIANVADEGQKARGRGLKQQLEQVAGGTDLCAIDRATASLRSWVGTVAPALEQGRQQAIARNEPHLARARRLLDDFGSLLDAGTAGSLGPAADSLADLLKNSYDTAAIDAAGAALGKAAGPVEETVRRQMAASADAVEAIRKGPLWSRIEAGRRRWIEANLADVRKALPDMSRPDLLAAFARVGPRTRVEAAVVSAFDALNGGGDAAAAVRSLEDLGPSLRSESAALSFALSYAYWWQARGAAEPEREPLLQKARSAYQSGRALQVDPSGLAGSLFAPAFVAEMAASAPGTAG